MSDANSTVLVIDDDPDLRASVGRLLRSLGIDVQLFASISAFIKSDPRDASALGPTGGANCRELRPRRLRTECWQDLTFGT
jgi:hypothetical protein